MEKWRVNLDHIAGVLDMEHTKDDLAALRELMRSVASALRQIAQSPPETPPPPKLKGARSWMVFDPSGSPTEIVSHVDKYSAQLALSSLNKDIPWESLHRQGFTVRPLWWTSVERVEDYEEEGTVDA